MTYYSNDLDFLIQLARIDLNCLDYKKVLDAISFMIDERMRDLHQPPTDFNLV